MPQRLMNNKILKKLNLIPIFILSDKLRATVATSRLRYRQAQVNLPLVACQLVTHRFFISSFLTPAKVGKKTIEQ